jgi:hypothetical protein
VTTADFDDAVIARRRRKGQAKGRWAVPLGPRWPVERTRSWLTKFGQLRRNTDRSTAHRLAQSALAALLPTDEFVPGLVPRAQRHVLEETFDRTRNDTSPLGSPG